MNATAIITAGGTGERFGGQIPKQFIEIAGLPMIVHTLRAFESAGSIDHVVVVLPKRHVGEMTSAILERYAIQKVRAVVPGGETRQASVGCGLEAIDWDPACVAIHDAARCLITTELIDRTVKACEGWDGAILALPVRDTLKRVEGQIILKTEPRENLWAMQTPQVFRFPFIRDAYRKASAVRFAATDDAAVAEFSGGRIRVVEGGARNLKVTYSEDLLLAERLLTGEQP